MVSLPHRRSVKAQQRRDARRIVLEASFRDRDLAETVNRVKPNELITELRKKYSTIFVEVARVDPGEILIDSRGRGTLQQIQPERR